MNPSEQTTGPSFKTDAPKPIFHDEAEGSTRRGALETRRELSVVVPVYRSAQGLPELLRRLEQDLLPLYPTMEAVLVNDGSPDESWEVLSELALRHPFLVAVDLRKNRGQDNAIMTGLRLSAGEIVVIMDDDLQHDPLDIPRLVEKIRQGWDVCFASFAQKKQAWWKNLGSAFNGWVASHVLDKPTEIYLSPFKSLSRGVVDEILQYEGPYPYVDGLLLAATDSFSQVDCEHHSRVTGSSNYNLIRSVAVWLKLATGFSVLPLRMASFAGLLTSLLSLCFAAFLVVRWFLVHAEVEGWTSTLVFIAFLGGVQLFALGLVGEYVGRAYLAINRKPQASIRRILRTPHGD